MNMEKDKEVEKLLDDIDLKNPLIWAYIGDAVFELEVRKRFVEKSNANSFKLHLKIIKIVNAKNQAKLFDMIEDKLSEKELDIARRARNTKNHHLPKNTSVAEYSKSTAFEAVLGYNYLKGNHLRNSQLIDNMFSIIEKMDN